MAETNPYLENMRKDDQHEEDMQRTIRDRGRTAAIGFLLLSIALAGNFYQLQQAKVVPYIHQVDSHGEVVTRLLLRPDEIPSDDPLRQALIRKYIHDWVENARVRSIDRNLTAKGLTSAARASAGPALVKLRTGLVTEDPFARIKKETVEVLMPKSPIHLAGDTWQAEWQEVVTGQSGAETKKENWTGSFTLAQQDDWVTNKNPLGLRVVNWTAEPFGK
jgi:type IV secretory pathway TrbF-like protein